MSESHDIPEQTCSPESIENHKGHGKKEMCSASFRQGTAARLM